MTLMNVNLQFKYEVLKENYNGTMTSHGRIPKGQYDNLPKMFKATDGNEYPIEDIIVLG